MKEAIWDKFRLKWINTDITASSIVLSKICGNIFICVFVKFKAIAIILI